MSTGSTLWEEKNTHSVQVEQRRYLEEPLKLLARIPKDRLRGQVSNNGANVTI